MSIMPKEWEGFTGGSWTKTIDVRGFIQKNYTPYEGDESFLVGPTAVSYTHLTLPTNREV